MFNLCSIKNYENKSFKNNSLIMDTVTENPRISGSISFPGIFPKVYFSFFFYLTEVVSTQYL
jgi:hypothetical protein